MDRGTPTGGGQYGDTPGDLDCDLGRWCVTDAPASSIDDRSDSIVTQVRNGSSWSDVTGWGLDSKWVGSHSLMPYGGKVNRLPRLDRIRRVGLAGGGPGIAMPPVTFDAVLSGNRADYPPLPARVLRSQLLW